MNMRIKHGPHLCPICGKYKFLSWGSYDVCDYCGWEDDPVQTDDPDYEAGANEWSLNEYKENYNNGWRAYWIDDTEMEEAREK